MSKYIVTGASGFIGNALTKKLLANGDEVWAIVRSKDKINNLDSEKLHIIEADFTQYSQLSDMIAGKDFDCFFHLAWQGTWGAAFQDYTLQLNNAKYACDALLQAAKINCQRFILIGTIVQLEAKKYLLSDEGIPRFSCIYGTAKNAAAMLCRIEAEHLKAEVQVKLENLCSNCVKKHAEELLWQYKKKIQELAKELNAGSVEIQPFEMMEGAISGIADIENVLQEAEKTEMKHTIVGNHREYKELFGFRRWLNRNIGADFNVDYTVIDDYDWVENRYIDGNELAAKVFGPLQKSLYEVKNLAGDYAKEQTRIIKREFSKKFDQLDAILADKLKDLEKYAKESRNLEGMIRENYSKLAWLEWISQRVNDILEI